MGDNYCTIYTYDYIMIILLVACNIFNKKRVSWVYWMMFFFIFTLKIFLFMLLIKKKKTSNNLIARKILSITFLSLILIFIQWYLIKSSPFSKRVSTGNFTQLNQVFSIWNYQCQYFKVTLSPFTDLEYYCFSTFSLKNKHIVINWCD